MGFFGAVKKMADKALEAFDNIANEDELDGVVAACVLIAAADGKIDDVEKETAFNAVAGHESLKSFSKDKIRAKFNSDANLINSDRELAEQVLYAKVQTIKDMTARIRVLGIAKQIAAADGVFSKEEQAIVDKIRRITG